jgi:hypothetical protein
VSDFRVVPNFMHDCLRGLFAVHHIEFSRVSFERLPISLVEGENRDRLISRNFAIIRSCSQSFIILEEKFSGISWFESLLLSRVQYSQKVPYPPLFANIPTIFIQKVD